MKDYSDFPPFKYFIRVLKTCPKSALVYVQIWKKKQKNKNTALNISKKDIRKDFLISPTMFRNLLSPLMFMNLMSFTEAQDRFLIDIVGMNLNE